MTVAKWTQRDFFSRASVSQKGQLLTIPYSHYNELARWSLIYGKHDYEEWAHAPFQHVLPMLKARMGSGMDHRGSGSKVRGAKKILEDDQKKGNDSGQQATKASATGVPMYIKPDGSVLKDSIEIANELSGLTPLTDEEIIELYDEKLGPLTRQLAYSFLLKTENRASWDLLVTQETFGGLWGYIWYWTGDKMTLKMIDIFQPNDKAVVEATHRALLEVFEIIAEKRIRSRPGKYINGDEVTTEDLVCASLAAAVCFPRMYCRGAFTSLFDELLERDADSKAKVEEYRDTDLGKYALWFYEEKRSEGLDMNPI